MSKFLKSKRNKLLTNDQAYTDVWDHLSDELKQLDIRIRIQVVLQQSGHPENLFDQLKGLVLSEGEVSCLLNDSPIQEQNLSEVEALTKQLVQLESSIKRRRALSYEEGVFLPLTYLFSIFELSSFEEKCVVICLAVELDRKYEKLYAFLQDDITCKNPTVDLTVKLLCATQEEKLASRLVFTPRGKLNKYFFKSEEEAGEKASSLSRVLRLDERIIGFLLDSGRVDDSINAFAEVVIPAGDLPLLLIGQDIQEKIRKYVESNYGGEKEKKKSVIFYLYGPSGSGKKLQVKHFCCYFEQPLMIVNLAQVIASDRPFAELVGKIGREAIIQQVVLCFQNFNVLLSGEDVSRKRLNELLEEIRTFSGIVFLLADCYWKPTTFMTDNYFIDIEFSILPDYERKQLWEHLGKGYVVNDEVDWGTMANKFRFTPGQIQNALETAQNMASWHSIENGRIGKEELYKACYAQVHHSLGKKSTRVELKYTWNDIILPPEQKEQLANACNQIKYRHIVYGQWGFERKLSYGKGLSMLFSGPPGTGKTMSAQVIAKELYMELYKIDLAQVVSKYIGETEKNLQEIFREAHLSNAILFFDEADALFGKRSEVKDSHDRYANIETAFLLQKIEEYEGITILASNFMQNIDEAFMRRINYIIEFPFPDAEYRQIIWKSMFPIEAPISKSVDFDFIASKFEVTGGNIKNIAVSAAFLAAEGSDSIEMKHIIKAAKYELHKVGKILLKEDLEGY